MSDGIALLSMSLFASSALFVATFFVYPAAQRVRFVRQIARVRDEVTELLVTGKLENDPCVQDFSSRLEFMIDHPRAINLSRVLAVHWAHADLGVSFGNVEPIYEQLRPDQRDRMSALDERVVNLIASRLVLGSRFGVFLEIGWWMNRFVRSALGARDGRPAVVPSVQSVPVADTVTAKPDPVPEFVPDSVSIHTVTIKPRDLAREVRFTKNLSELLAPAPAPAA